MRKLCSYCFAIAFVCTFFSPAQAAYLGKKFPNFTGKDARSGKNISLEDLNGQVVLVDFWATWCGPCVGEIPSVKKTYDQFKDQGFTIVSISLDSDKAKCKRFIEDRGMDWLHIVDGGGWNARLAKKFNIRSIPAMFVIDHEGMCIAEDARGSQLTSVVEKAVKKIPPKAAEAKKPQAKPKEPPPPSIKPSVQASPPTQPLAPTLSDIDAKRMQSQLSAIDNDLEDVIAIFSRYTKRIDAAQQTIPLIESDLPSPKRAASTREVYLRLRNDVIALRKELFALGLLNERLIRAPYDPFAGQPVTELRAFFQAKTQLPLASSSLAEMARIVGLSSEPVNAMRSDIAKLNSEISEGRGDPNQMQARCDALCERGRTEVQHWRSAWQGQLQHLHEVVVQLHAPVAQTEARCAEIESRIASIRDGLKVKPGAPVDLAKSRDEFSRLVSTISSVAHDLQIRGVAKSITLPSNPYEKRNSNERVLAAEAEVQLKVAAESVRQVRSVAVGLGEAAEREAQAFIPRIQELQSRVAANASDAKALSQVQTQYESLCAEILAVNDQNSPS